MALGYALTNTINFLIILTLKPAEYLSNFDCGVVFNRTKQGGINKIVIINANRTPDAVKMPNSFTIWIFTIESAPKPIAVVILVKKIAIPIFCNVCIKASLLFFNSSNEE